MQRASEETPSGMMTVFCFWGTKLNLATEAAKQYCKEQHHIEDPVCRIASYLFPEVKVIAGHEEVQRGSYSILNELHSFCTETSIFSYHSFVKVFSIPLPFSSIIPT